MRILLICIQVPGLILLPCHEPRNWWLVFLLGCIIGSRRISRRKRQSYKTSHFLLWLISHFNNWVVFVGIILRWSCSGKLFLWGKNYFFFLRQYCNWKHHTAKCDISLFRNGTCHNIWVIVNLISTSTLFSNFHKNL